MKELSETANIDLFSLKIIKFIILYQWRYFKKMIIFIVFIPFVLYFALFLTYATYSLHEKNQENASDTSKLVSYILMVCIMALWGFFGYIEAAQIHFHGLEYFINFWNMLDLGSLVLNLLTVVWDFFDIDVKDAAVAVLLM